MTKLTGAALDRAVANAMGLKSVHNCENWGDHMSHIEEDDDTQVYKKPWVGLTDAEIDNLCWGFKARDFARNTEAKLKAINGFHSTENNT